MLTDLIPIQYRMMAAIIGVAVLAAASAVAGAVVEHWRMDAAGQHDIAAEKASYATLLAQHNALKLSTEKQNGAVNLLGAKTEAAEARSEQAEKLAASAIKSAAARVAAAKSSAATTCGGVLRETWGK